MRSPDEGSLQWHLGGAAPLGPCAQDGGWLLPSSPSHPLSSSTPALPLLLPAWPILSPTQPKTRSLLPAGHRLSPIPQDHNHEELLFI